METQLRPPVEEQAASTPKKVSGRFLTIACLFVIVLFTAALYAELVSYHTFGPEFANFYKQFCKISHEEVILSYENLSLPWYRPTEFILPYWLGSRIISWHNVVGWKILNLCTALTCSLLLYWLVTILFPRNRVAGLLAAIYFIANPTMYMVEYEISAFDFNHILFGLLTGVVFFLSLRAKGFRRAVLTAAAVASYAAALTAKEINFVIPLYLAAATALVAFYENRRREWRVLAAQLLPFFLLMAAYWVFHIQVIQKRDFWSDVNGGYRTKANMQVIVENVIKYPLWMARMFTTYPPSTGQANDFVNRRTNVAGLALTLVTLCMCIRNARRDRAVRLPLLLLLLWAVILSAVAVYSGGYLWHANLAMAGYAGLFGYAAASVLELMPAPRMRWVALGTFLIAFLFLARSNVSDYLLRSLRRPLYRLNYTALERPPVPFAVLHNTKALIYIEDVDGFGPWGYGGANNLFQLVYLNTAIRQQLTPPMQKVDANECRTWMRTPRAYFFTLDTRLNWVDSSDELRRYCQQKLKGVDISGTEITITQAGVTTTLNPPVAWVVGDGFTRGMHAIFVDAKGKREESSRVTISADSNGVSVTLPPNLSSFNCFGATGVCVKLQLTQGNDKSNVYDLPVPAK